MHGEIKNTVVTLLVKSVFLIFSGASRPCVDFCDSNDLFRFNSIAGVRVTQTGSTLGHMTSIRMPLNTGPYYLFLQDGIPVQSSGFFNHNGLAYTNFSSAGAAEVLKGAGTTLYGSDAIAATINVISNDPTLTEGQTVKADTGSNGFYKLGLSSGFSTGEDSSLGFELSHTQSDGWRDHSASERNELNVTHFYTLDDSNTLKTIFAANTTEAEMSGSIIGLDALEDDPTSAGDIQSALDSGLEIERKFDFARLSTEWTHDLNDATQLSTIAYLRSNRNRYTATWQRNLPHNDSKQQTAGVLFKADIDNGATRWIAGTDLEITRSNLTYKQILTHHQLDQMENWIFNDSMPERLRLLIDPSWYGELPRAYFYDTAHQRSVHSGSLTKVMLEQWLKNNRLKTDPELSVK